MDGKDSVCKVLRSIMGLEISLNRDLLLDYVMGTLSQPISQRGLDNTEDFGCGDEKDEEYWSMVLDQMTEAGHIKMRSEGVSITAKGKKFLKKPTEFDLKDGEEEEAQVANMDDFVDSVLIDGQSVTAPKVPSRKSATSQRKLALIQAVDRHVALDDFANNHGLDFDEVMDDMEGILASGTKLDLNYFGLEVLGQEAMDELFEYYDNAPSDNLNAAFDEYGDVYKAEELRLGRILWRVSKM